MLVRLILRTFARTIQRVVVGCVKSAQTHLVALTVDSCASASSLDAPFVGPGFPFAGLFRLSSLTFRGIEHFHDFGGEALEYHR